MLVSQFATNSDPSISDDINFTGSYCRDPGWADDCQEARIAQNQQSSAEHVDIPFALR